MDSTLKLLNEKLEEERKIILDSMGDGTAKDYAEYQHNAGRIRGLMTAQRIIADLAKHMETDDE